MMISSRILLTFVSLWTSASGFGFAGRAQSLYSAVEDPDIAQLNSSNLRPTVLGSDRAWLVEFYSSWCGHCIHFAPTYKALAKETSLWKGVVALAAIDCADDANTAICREFEIMGYPSMKFFPPKAHKDDLGHVPDGRPHEIPALKKAILNYVAKAANNQSLIESVRKWPDLQPL